MKRLWMLCAVLTFGLIPQVIFAAEAKAPPQELLLELRPTSPFIFPPGVP